MMSLFLLVPTEDTSDNLEDSLYDRLEHVFDQVLQYRMKMLLGSLNPKIGRTDLFKPTVGNESLHEINNDAGVILVYFTISKNLIVESIKFPHYNIHKFIWIFTSRNTIRFVTP
jgi:hypothetical protein